MDSYQHILTAVDTSVREANLVVSRAVELAKASGATFSLIHVVEPRGDEMATPSIEDSILNHARQALESIARSLPMKPKNATVAVGSPRYEISAAAEKERADLIVVGTHGRHGFQRLLGSTASAVAQSSPCDVLIVHLPASDS